MTNEPRPLKTLYELLWEQIKDLGLVVLSIDVRIMARHGLISPSEKTILIAEIYQFENLTNITSTKGSKDFVQHMIKELTIKE